MTLTVRLAFVAILLFTNNPGAFFWPHLNCSLYKTCKSCSSLNNQCSWDPQLQICEKRIGDFDVSSCKITKSFECPIRPNDKYAYSDHFARYVMFRIASSAAAETGPIGCLKKAVKDAKLIRNVVVPCQSNKTILAAFVAVSKKKKALIMAFRGTDSVEQLYTEGAHIFSFVKMGGGGKVNRYFYKAFEKLWTNGLHKAIAEGKKAYSDYELWVTGISLGGAMATIAVHIVVNAGIFEPEEIKLITFGEPRTGDREFAEIHNKFPYSYRVTHAQDVVPQLPPKSLCGYYHHRYEVWYNNSMKKDDPYKICFSPEDCQCSNSNGVNLGILDHMTHFNIFVFNFTDNDCNYY